MATHLQFLQLAINKGQRAGAAPHERAGMIFWPPWFIGYIGIIIQLNFLVFYFNNSNYHFPCRFQPPLPNLSPGPARKLGVGTGFFFHQSIFSILYNLQQKIYLMFCQVNPFTFRLLLKPAAPAPPHQKLYQSLGMALQLSIEAFQTRRSKEDRETVASQNSLSLSKSLLNEDKSEKTDVLSEHAEDKENNKEKVSQLCEIKNPNLDPSPLSIQNLGALTKPIRRIIRKKNARGREEQKPKKESKVARQKQVRNSGYMKLTAEIPAVGGINPRQILRKMAELNKRAVVQWNSQDPCLHRRKRFSKC